MQNPIPVTPFNAGGLSSALNISVATVVKATLGSVVRIIVQTAPTAGNLVVNDNNSTVTGNTAATQVLSVPFGSLVDGQVIDINWPCKTGITVSSVGAGGVFAVSYL